ncbi:MAG: hypothetical protein JXM70_25625 [Pirellulales bacterium]|nr:hypothetical protein [Pirellulales bacterium]
MKTPEDRLDIGREVLAGLLDELRVGHTANSKINIRWLKQHLQRFSDAWDQRFPGFPKITVPCSSSLGECLTAARDKHLKRIIVGLLQAKRPEQRRGTVVNPACVFGRHARHLAVQLKSFQVIGTDINPRFNNLYECSPIGRSPSNYKFIKDDIFDPKLKTEPTAVVFFGACGSVSDGAIDYGITHNAQYLAFRTCCHDNIGGNTKIERKFTVINWAFRFKNYVYSRKREKRTGEYFSDKYSKEQYPRSNAARALSDSNEFSETSSKSVDSDICRAIIDMDRYLYLVEKGYEVWFQGDLFVARKIVNTSFSVGNLGDLHNGCAAD